MKKIYILFALLFFLNACVGETRSKDLIELPFDLVVEKAE